MSRTSKQCIALVTFLLATTGLALAQAQPIKVGEINVLSGSFAAYGKSGKQSAQLAVVLELKHTGTAVLLAEQNLPFVSRLPDRVYVLESGELRLEGTMSEMAEKEQVKTLLAL